MNITQIENLIATKSTEYLEASKRANKLMIELNSLKAQLELVKKEEFVEYLQLGEEIETGTRFFNHSGTPLRGGENVKISNKHCLFSGDTFKVIKKNKKSIVIEVTKFKRNSGNIEINNPGIKYRIDLDIFYNYYICDEIRKTSFTTYIKRKIALQQILG
jgi:NurA-like 5'-3' nuclease